VGKLAGASFSIERKNGKPLLQGFAESCILQLENGKFKVAI